MPFTPSTTAQAIATTAGSNMASLTTPLTALQTSIAGGNLAPAAYIDAFSSYSYIAPTLGNSWVNYGGIYNTAGYFKDACGVVHIRGLIKSGTLTATAFTLPAGYRPAARMILSTAAGTGGSDVHGRLDIDASGNVMPISGGNDYFSLQASFYATQ